MDERRRFPRYGASLEVEYDLENTVGIESKTNTLNISLAGISIPLNRAVREGKRLGLKIKVPDGKEVRALGKVVWKKAIGKNLFQEEDAGIKFLGIYNDGADVLDKYLQTIAA